MQFAENYKIIELLCRKETEDLGMVDLNRAFRYSWFIDKKKEFLRLKERKGRINMDYLNAALTIIELSGGNGNISSVTHCATRLRLFIMDKSQVKLDEIKKVKGVLGTVFVGDELQIVLGKNLIPVYNEVTKLHDPKKKEDGKKDAVPVPEEKKTGKE